MITYNKVEISQRKTWELGPQFIYLFILLWREVMGRSCTHDRIPIIFVIYYQFKIVNVFGYISSKNK